MDLDSKAVENVNKMLGGLSVTEEVFNNLVDNEIQKLKDARTLALMTSAMKGLEASKRHEFFIEHLRKNIVHSLEIDRTKSSIFKISSNAENAIEKHPDLNINMLKKEVVLQHKNEIIDFFNSFKNKRNFLALRNSYASIVLNKNGSRFCSTHSVNLSLETFEEDIDRLYEHLSDLMVRILDNIYGYEEFYQKDGLADTIFQLKTFYDVTPKSIKNWFIDTPTINMQFCSLFCANKKDIDCLVQCSRLLFNKDCYTLEDFCKNDVLILCPKKHIKHIKDIKYYYDVEVYYKSPIKYIDVFNINKMKVALIFKGHMGVMYDFKSIKKKIHATTYTPIKILKKEDIKLSVIFDIEAYFDPYDELNQINIPYICCFAYIINDKVTDVFDEEGPDCVLQMLINICSFCENNGVSKIELVAHNGGNYDFHYILSSIPDPSIIKNILLRNNSFISFSFNFGNVEFSVKDSYSFLLCSLKNAARAFLTEGNTLGKTEFPHHEVKSREDLERVFRKWEEVKEVLDVDYHENKMVISSHNIMIYSESVESKKLIDWSKDYCRNDVIVLANVWREFRIACEEIFGAPIVDTSFTLAGMSFNLFRAHANPDVFLYHPEKDDYMKMRDALYGGRCVSSNGIYSDILCLDVKSLYPAAMSYYDQPYGNFKRVKKRNKDLLGIYFVSVEVNSNPPSNFFPLRGIKGETVYTTSGVTKFSSWYTSVDIDIGIQEEHVLTMIPFDDEGYIGYEWESRGQIFQNYIQNTLYVLKNKYEQEGEKVKRNVIKIIMNSLWGKFAQKWVDSEYDIDNAYSHKVEDNEEITEIWNTNYLLVKNTVSREYGSKPVQNGVFTLSWARWHMKKIWDATVKPYTKYIYSDTDSIFIRRADFCTKAKIMINNKLIDVIGSELGQLELELELDELLCAGKKQYIGFKKEIINGKLVQTHKSRFKGVPSRLIVPEMFEFILKEGNIAEIHFIKFRKLAGAIKGYGEVKTVKAT